MIKILFVCMGNICRSPTAEAVFRYLVEEQDLQEDIFIASAGTTSYHVGEKSDERAARAAKARGYDLSAIRGQHVQDSDFAEFDMILAMDHANMANLKKRCPSEHQHKLHMFLAFGASEVAEVPDPYYGAANGFEVVLDLVEDAAEGLLAHIKKQYLVKS